MAITKINEHLYLGSQDDACRLLAGNDLGISAVVNVAEEPDYPLCPGIAYFHIPVECGEGITSDVFQTAISVIVDFLGSRKVLVHCVGGYSRSPVVVAAYLAVTEGVSIDEALDRLRALRPRIDPSPANILAAKYYLWQRVNTEKQGAYTAEELDREEPTKTQKFNFKALRKRSPPCPKCRTKKDVVPILYGLPAEYPNPMSRERIENSVWGGCVIRAHAPGFLCRKCGGMFGTPFVSTFKRLLLPPRAVDQARGPELWRHRSRLCRRCSLDDEAIRLLMDRVNEMRKRIIRRDEHGFVDRSARTGSSLEYADDPPAIVDRDLIEVPQIFAPKHVFRIIAGLALGKTKRRDDTRYL